jgi:hypothetical protein
VLCIKHQVSAAQVPLPSGEVATISDAQRLLFQAAAAAVLGADGFTAAPQLDASTGFQDASGGGQSSPTTHITQRFLVAGRSFRACLLVVDGWSCKGCYQQPYSGTQRRTPDLAPHLEVEHRAQSLTLARNT